MLCTSRMDAHVSTMSSTRPGRAMSMRRKGPASMPRRLDGTMRTGAGSTRVRIPQEKELSMRHIRTPALVLAVSLLAAATASAAPPATDAVPAHLRFAMQRDLDIQPQQIPQYLDAERLAASVERDARTRLGAQYAGAWLERDATGRYRTVVAATRPNIVSVRGVAQPVRVVEHSLRTLDTARAKLDAAARAATSARNAKAGGLDARIHAWHVDVRSNRIVVTTDLGAGHAARDFVAASGVDTRLVRYAESAARPDTMAFDMRGGDGYTVSGLGSCSIGFAVTLGANNGFVSAGHCGPSNAATTHFNGQSVGYIYQSVFPGSDYAVIHNTNPQGIPRPWVNAYQYGGNLVVRGSTPAVVGAAVCRSGIRTGARCGTLQATGVSVNYGGQPVHNLSATSACAGRGDSGGSFVTPEGQAQGVVSGGPLEPGTNDNCTIGTPMSYFQPIGPVLSAYGLTLVTSP
jgi:streptogrisin C